MVDEFTQLRLAEIVATVIDNRGKTPPWGENEPIELIETASIVGDNKYPDYSLVQKRVSNETYNNWFRGHPRAKDILIATVGANIGNLSIMRESRGCVAQNLVGLRIDENQADPDYVYYFLTWEPTKIRLKNLDIGAAQPSIKVPHLLNIEILLPSLPEQRAIAGILEALDDKIELNRRINRTLESMARAVFRKMMNDEDGKETTIGEVVTIVGGSTPSTKNPAFWNGGDIHWVTPKDLSGLQDAILLDSNSRITELGLQKISSGLLPVGTVLLSSRAPIGYLAITQIPTAINQGFIAIKCTEEVPNYFILNWLNDNMEEIKGRANGTTFLEISKSNFRPMPIFIPSPKKMQEFVNIVEPMYQKIVANLKESRTLASLRDSLLSKLMRGEVRVKDVESKG